MPVTSEVQATVQRFRDAFNAGDAGALGDLLASTPDVLGIGSDPQEWWPGRAKLMPVLEAQLQEMGGARFEFGELIGSGAWAAAPATIVMPDDTRVAGRLTMVCTDEGKIEHFHFSVGVANEEAIGQELTT